MDLRPLSMTFPDWRDGHKTRRLSDAHGQSRDGTAGGREICGAEGVLLAKVVIVALLVHVRIRSRPSHRVALIRRHGAEPGKAWAREAVRNGGVH